MRILFVHNFYGSEAPSGENQVVKAEIELLTQRGHQVELFARYSDDIRGKGVRGVIQGALATPWNPFSVSALRKKVADFQPDVVHAHNTFPLISPAIFPALRGRTARVLTLHNYRLFCAAGVPLRDGLVCTECLDKHHPGPALLHGCYRGSRIATLPLAASIGLHRLRGTWTQDVDAFIALTEFQRATMSRAGLPADKVHIKPNFYPGYPEVVPWEARADKVVFVGRLSDEKGVRDLIKAWRQWGAAAPLLRIVGDGPLRAELQNMAADGSVQFMGQLDSAAAQAEIANARLLILPSVCFEGFPMVVREAFAYGTPVAVSRLGALPSIVRDGACGALFNPADYVSLLTEVRLLWERPNTLHTLAAAARSEFESCYTEAMNYRILMDIYQRAISTSSTSPAASAVSQQR
ncbi:MAG: glycosyltransferase family 4 protein [Steroidobacteraceae bacterium]